MDDLVLAENQRDQGITRGAKEKEERAWRRWIEFCEYIKNSYDPYMQELTPKVRTQIYGAFASALRRRVFSRPDEAELATGTVQETVAKVGEIFRANVGYNPHHGEHDGTIAS